MDYGQPSKMDNRQPFFTAGAGTNQVEDNTFEAENNLNSNNFNSNNALVDRDANRNARDIGNIAINSPELPKSISERMMPDGGELPKMGEVFEAGLPPDVDDTENNTGETTEILQLDEMKQQKQGDAGLDESSWFDESKIKTGDSLSADGIKEMQKVINKLEQDGNVADFYEAGREMMEVNIERSYGPNAAWKGGKAA